MIYYLERKSKKEQPQKKKSSKKGTKKKPEPIIVLDKNKKRITDKKIIEYVRKLVIPPAYHDVKIFYENNPKILFEGYDDKNRKQQIYSQAHKKKAMKKKFCHLLDFGRCLPKIQSDINKHIKSPKQSYDKIISLIIKIVMICGFRVGNLKYQKLYNSFGISNIHKKHIKTNKSGMTIKFIGKKGVVNECVITNNFLIAEINKLLVGKTNTDYVFTYDKDGVDTVIKAIEINKWLKQYNKNITSKMFRTHVTNTMFIEFMRDKGSASKHDIKTRKKNVVDAMNVISCQINNTPNICRKEYLFIDILNLYLEHPVKYNKYFNKCDSAEKCFLNYLEKICT